MQDDHKMLLVDVNLKKFPVVDLTHTKKVITSHGSLHDLPENGYTNRNIQCPS
jgi:hypothetical protein